LFVSFTYTNVRVKGYFDWNASSDFAFRLPVHGRLCAHACFDWNASSDFDFLSTDVCVHHACFERQNTWLLMPYAAAQEPYMCCVLTAYERKETRLILGITISGKPDIYIYIYIYIYVYTYLHT
jgi:hypothetical protein